MEGERIPCEQLMHLCEGRCCKLQVERTREDRGAGPVRWDAQTASWVVQRDDGYCVHNAETTGRCDIYTQRPSHCRSFDCRDDPRIWADYERRVPAPYFAIDAAVSCITVPSVSVPIEQLC